MAAGDVPSLDRLRTKLLRGACPVGAATKQPDEACILVTAKCVGGSDSEGGKGGWTGRPHPIGARWVKSHRKCLMHRGADKDAAMDDGK